MIISRTPFRISFFGGGTDYPVWFREHGGAVLATTIDNVLKLQQAVDGTLKGVAVTEEFKSTLVELKRHLAESDVLLKNAAKPRTIRLVEKDNE